MAAYDGNVRRVLANWENDPLILKTRTYYIRFVKVKNKPLDIIYATSSLEDGARFL